MPWDDDPAFEQELADALKVFDWSRAAEICERLVRRIHAEPEVFPEKRARKCLSLLRRKRRFRLVTELAEALIASGQRAPQVRRQYAQALIDQGVLAAAELVLQPILQDSRLDETEEKEARGLLGRVYKQLYVNAAARLEPGVGRAGGPRLSGFMQRALSEYLAGYRLDPAQNYWHGINAVALLARAGRDGITIAGAPHYNELAYDIIRTLEERAQKVPEAGDKTVRRRGLDAWELATAMEAWVAAGYWERQRGELSEFWEPAKTYALEYAAHPDADAFEIASTLRQLMEVWQLTESEPPGSLLLPICRAALLQREGGAFRISPESAARDLSHIEEVAASGGRPEADSTPAPGAAPDPESAPLDSLNKYREALTACRSVARIESHEGVGRGTGLLVRAEEFLPPEVPWPEGRPLLLTNAHVVSPVPFPTALLPSEAEVVFQLADRRCEIDRVVWSSPPDELDATLLALKDFPPDAEPLRLATRWSSLSDVPPRTLLVGHPGGADSRFSLKAGGDDGRFSFQDAAPTDSDFDHLRYSTPRPGGSSGSAVFDPRDWSVVALHHSGAGGGAGEAATYTNEAVHAAVLRHTARTELSGGRGESDVEEHRPRLRSGRKSAKPQAAPEGPEATAEGPEARAEGPASRPRFYFALEGEGTRGRFVRYGADVDLIFDYAVPPVTGVIGKVSGERLDEARRALTPLGVTVAPVGFTFRDERDSGFRVMRFHDGGARADKLRFELRADDEPTGVGGTADPRPPTEAGFHVIFEVRGSILYQFFLPVRLVSGLPPPGAAEAELPPLDLDLDGINRYAEEVAADELAMEAALKEVLSHG